MQNLPWLLDSGVKDVLGAPGPRCALLQGKNQDILQNKIQETLLFPFRPATFPTELGIKHGLKGNWKITDIAKNVIHFMNRLYAHLFYCTIAYIGNQFSVFHPFYHEPELHLARQIAVECSGGKSGKV